MLFSRTASRIEYENALENIQVFVDIGSLIWHGFKFFLNFAIFNNFHITSLSSYFVILKM